MILITGGLGFIGAHTARALLDLGQSCVITRHRRTRYPAFLAAAREKTVFVEEVDVTDREALVELGKRYTISGIIHLASPGADATDPVDAVHAHTIGLLNVFRAARLWSVARTSIASSLAVYRGVPASRYHEDLPLAMTSAEPMHVLKMSAELHGALVAERDGLDVVNLRLSTIWGPLRRHNEAPFSAIPALLHGGRRAITPVSLDVYGDDGRDLCYVKDCARGIALLQLADSLRHRTYNVADGRPTTNRDIVAAITAALPGTVIDLPAGHDPDGPGHPAYLDITRISADTGYQPAYGLETGIGDYLAWLRAGHDY